jgi:hypothetical protein
MVVNICNPHYVGGTGGRIMVQADLSKKHETLSEKIKQKWMRDMDQVVECLPSKWTLSSNPSIAKKKGGGKIQRAGV